ncbi:DEAD/DEAH box helicase family protein [Nakamurella deserti]|uniref:DEAD/DEAH box helicase family protein n=1 Tax=Nakamurella deserti TaxID=2164074 RepID=UPI00197BE833|nr:DEAD/DEAH box helicase family protein [Nakamurella deserti]
MPRTTRRRPARRPAAPRPTSPHDPTAGRLWYLAVPFQQQVDGAVWDPARKAHTHTAHALPAHLAPYRSQPYTVLRRREDDANGTPGAPPPPVAAMTPRDLQVDGARAIVTAAATRIGGAPARGFLLTDDTGVGKTVTAFLALKEIAAARTLTRLLILVDRPKQITVPHWRRTVTALGPGDLDILIASPDELPHLLDGTTPRWTWDLLAVDEAQLYRNPDTARVRRYRAVSRFRSPHAKAPFTLWMTATPGNHPAELTYLAPLLAQVHGEPTTRWTDFGGRLLEAGLPIRKGPYGTWTWDGAAADDTAAQQDATRTVRRWLLDAPAPLTLHRAAPWGPAPLEPMPVTLTPDERIAYDVAWSAFRGALRALEDDREIRGRAATATGRAAVLRFRQKASLLRVPATVAWVLRAVEAGRQVPVSCEFVGAAAQPIADAVEAAGVPVARIFGGTTGADAEAERLHFQTGAAKVVVFTPTSSLSLQAGEHLADGDTGSAAPREALMHNVRFSGIAARQVLGRSHRDGQICPWHLAYAEDTAEEQIASLMVGRLRATADTAGADSAALAGIAEILGVSWLPDAALAEPDPR